MKTPGEADSAPLATLGLPALVVAAEEARDDRILRRALAIAALVHLVLLFVTVPSTIYEPRPLGQAAQQVFKVQQVRFRPPAPAAPKQVQKPKRRKVPVPDPTPDDPEPIVDQEAEVEVPDIDVPAVGAFLDVPPGPPGPPGIPDGVMAVEGDVQPPLKVHAPIPPYTEEARQSRIQGVVILRAIIDEAGGVTDVVVLKGLPLGLSDSAVDTVRQWRFKPATLDGKPVPVYFNLTISFRIQ